MKRVLAGIAATTTVYAIFLQRFKRWLEPDWTWFEVVVGDAIILGGALIMRKLRPDMSAKEYERQTWLAFIVGGIPIIFWQVWQRLADSRAALDELRGDPD